MSYFECNLPDSCPYICAGKRSYFEDTVKVIKARMAKLDDALAKSGMDGAAFAKTAKILFDNSFDLFERMDSVELAMWVQNSYDGKPIEHRFEWPNAEVVVDCAFVQTKEWEALRHFGIGGACNLHRVGKPQIVRDDAIGCKAALRSLCFDECAAQLVKAARENAGDLTLNAEVAARGGAQVALPYGDGHTVARHRAAALPCGYEDVLGQRGFFGYGDKAESALSRCKNALQRDGLRRAARRSFAASVRRLPLHAAAAAQGFCHVFGCAAV